MQSTRDKTKTGRGTGQGFARVIGAIGWARMVLHPKTEALRKLLKQLDDAPLFAKAPYVRELVDRTLMLLAELFHQLDRIEKRLEVLEQFPELRIEPSDRVD